MTIEKEILEFNKELNSGIGFFKLYYLYIKSLFIKIN